MAAVGGASSLYPQDFNPTNPSSSNLILADHGRSATVMVLQVTPTVSVQLTERMSIGVAPIIDLASLNINPMSLNRHLATPLDTYGTKYVWGGGFQIGTFYDFQNHWKVGFMFKSPIWAEKLYFTGTYYDNNGIPNPDSATFQLNLPMTLSAGISYDGFRDTIIGMDVRYIDYSTAAGLDKGLEGNVVKGLDWESVFSINVGLERKINNRIKGRLGYCWNENPIPSRSSALCVSAPMITQHVFSCGFSYTFAKDLELSAAYCHAFRAKLSGEMAGMTVTNVLSADSLFAGITKKW
jgi:long-chain fatty acid transport protein